jgi:hypothetical protein
MGWLSKIGVLGEVMGWQRVGRRPFSAEKHVACGMPKFVRKT